VSLGPDLEYDADTIAQAAAARGVRHHRLLAEQPDGRTSSREEVAACARTGTAWS
jgi:hypothetical protein